MVRICIEVGSGSALKPMRIHNTAFLQSFWCNYKTVSSEEAAARRVPRCLRLERQRLSRPALDRVVRCRHRSSVRCGAVGSGAPARLELFPGPAARCQAERSHGEAEAAFPGKAMLLLLKNYFCGYFQPFKMECSTRYLFGVVNVVYKLIG
jgi:hypothetical protein